MSLNKLSKGLTDKEHDFMLQLFGPCLMDLNITPWYVMMFKESINFLYVFQVFNFTLWFIAGYYKYAAICTLMTVYSLYTELIDFRENINKLHKLANYEIIVKVKRINAKGNTYYEETKSSDLVPGDVFVVPDKSLLPCDALLIAGEAVVNEAMLTGESTVSHKIEIPKNKNVLTEFDITNFEQIKHFLFSGTNVIKTDRMTHSKCLALVVKTGFLSSKGKLVNSILYPEPERFKFHKEIKIYAYILFVLCISVILTTVPIMAQYFSYSQIIINILDALTFPIPPEIPIVMSIGVNFSLNRLKSFKISCLNVSRINVSGCISTMVFDKTGTLTENGISVNELVLYNGFKYIYQLNSEENKETIINMWKSKHIFQQIKNYMISKYFECLACCHSLMAVDNELIGDPLESEMFKVTKWTFDEQLQQNSNKKSLVFRPHNSEFRLKQLHQFDFLPDLQRMSVVAQNNFDSNYVLYVKGSPEKVFELCDNRSLPADYFDVLKKYTEAGKRVIAFAFRQLAEFEESQADRADLERELVFVGFLVFLNKLKPESIISIDKLKKGNVTTMMATGDNLLTGIAMARACKILTADAVVTIDLDPQTKDITFKHKKLRLDVEIRDSVASAERKSELSDVEEEAKLLDCELKPRASMSSTRSLEIGSLFDMMQGEHADTEIAVTGSAFESLVDLRSDNQSIDAYRARDIVKRVLVGARVYARMSPDQKAMLVKELQDETGENVGMCGDGANDCKALKVADVGLSLSEAEASIAAPFTSNVQNISSSVELLKLGRFSLDLSFTLFKLLMIFSLLNFIQIVIMYYHTTSLSDNQFIYIDICCIIPISIFLCWIEPMSNLPSYHPPNSLMSPSVLWSIIGHTVISVCGNIGIYIYLQNQEFYSPNLKIGEEADTQETTTMFLFVLPLYLHLAFTFFMTSKFRESIFSRFSFSYIFIIAYILFLMAIDYYMILVEDTVLSELLSLVKIPKSFRLVLVFSTLVMSGMYFAFEQVISRLVPISHK